jgi:ferredoxin
MSKKGLGILFCVISGLMIAINGCEKVQEVFSIKNDACTRCNACVPVCGYGAIRIDSVTYTSSDDFKYETTIVIDAQKCVGCGKCIKACQYNAISSNVDGVSGASSNK